MYILPKLLRKTKETITVTTSKNSYFIKPVKNTK